MPATVYLDQRDTHRLIPAQFAYDAAPVLSRITKDAGLLPGIAELDHATDEHFLVESSLAPGMDAPELIGSGIPSYWIINAAFCHPAPNGSRFNSGDRGAWYAAFELQTSQAEVAYHRQLWLEETNWDEEDAANYVDYLADFRAEFHDIRGETKYTHFLSPISYLASQEFAGELLRSGSAGIVYPSVRRSGGICIVCFRPVLVTNVRRDTGYTVVLDKSAARWF